jgi:MFS superfamily sulfate permease-like transporter
MFAGALQMISAFFGLGRLASRFPAPVVVGMVNAMALLLLALQGRYAKDFPLSEQDLEFMPVAGSDAAVEIDWNIALFSYFGKGFDWIGDNLNLGVYGGEVALSLLISMFLPRFTTFFPATLVSVLVIVGVEFGVARQFGVETPLIGDYGGSQVSEKWSTSGASDVLTVLPLLHVLTSIEHFLHSLSLSLSCSL